MSSMEMERIFIFCLTIIWLLRELPFIFDLFAVRAAPQPEKTCSDAVDVAFTQSHFLAVLDKWGNKCLFVFHQVRESSNFIDKGTAK